MHFGLEWNSHLKITKQKNRGAGIMKITVIHNKLMLNYQFHQLTGSVASVLGF